MENHMENEMGTSEYTWDYMGEYSELEIQHVEGLRFRSSGLVFRSLEVYCFGGILGCC